MNQVGRLLIVFGAVLVVVGVLFVIGNKVGLGRLPGDVAVKRDNFSFHFPIVTSIVISLILTVLLNLWLRRR